MKCLFSNYALKCSFFLQNSFVIKNTVYSSNVLVDLTQKVLNFIDHSTDKQYNPGKKCQSECSAIKYQLEVLLDTVKTHVIEIECVFESYS